MNSSSTVDCYLGLVMDDSMEACLLCIRGDFCNSATTPAHPCRWGLPTLSPWPIACVVSLRRGGFLVMPSVRACGNVGLTNIFWWCFSGSFAGWCSEVLFAATRPIYTTRNLIRNRSSLLTLSSNLFLFDAHNNLVLDLNLVPPSSVKSPFKSSLRSSPHFWISLNNFPIRSLSSSRWTLATSRS